MKNFEESYYVELLKPHFDKIVEGIRFSYSSMTDFKEATSNLGLAVDFKPKTCANIVHDCFEAYIIEYFEELDDETITATYYGELFGIYVKDECFIRFNKLNDDKSISNAKTKQRDQILTQGKLDIFPDNIVYLFLGYTTDVFWNSINGIFLACWNGTLEWHYDILENSVASLQHSLDFATTENQGRVKAKEKLVSAKKINEG